MHRHLSRLFQTIFWLALLAVVVLSLLPVHELPPIALNVWDKAQHAAGFFMLTALGTLAYPNTSRARLGWGLLACGIGIEIAQSALGWRIGDVLDATANGVGILLGLGLHRPLAHLSKALQSPR